MAHRSVLPAPAASRFKLQGDQPGDQDGGIELADQRFKHDEGTDKGVDRGDVSESNGGERHDAEIIEGFSARHATRIAPGYGKRSRRELLGEPVEEGKKYGDEEVEGNGAADTVAAYRSFLRDLPEHDEDQRRKGEQGKQRVADDHPGGVAEDRSGPERNGPGDQEDADPADGATLKSKDAGKQRKGEKQGRDHLKGMAEERSRRQDEEVKQQEDEQYGQAPLLGPECKESDMFSVVFLHTGLAFQRE
jgi:hypothetical protein